MRFTSILAATATIFGVASAIPSLPLPASALIESRQAEEGLNVVVLIVRKEGTTMAEFQDYYDNHHVPLISSLVFSEDGPLSYTRNFVERSAATVIGSGAAAFQWDAVTTIGCRDAAHRAALLAKFTEHNAEIAADEANFMDRTKSVMVFPSSRSAEF